MDELRSFHHFSTAHALPLDAVERLERYVADLMNTKRIPDDQRESSFTWEFKHASSTIQFARLIARRRNLAEKIGAAGLLLHDIHLTLVGTYADHARLGAEMVPGILGDVGGFSAIEIDAVTRLVRSHSDKHLVSKDPYEELGKDIDVLDCFLYPSAFDYYLRGKTLANFETYCRRARSLYVELGIPPDDRFSLLFGYNEPWLDLVTNATPATALPAGTSYSAWPPFVAKGGVTTDVIIAVNSNRLSAVSASSGMSPGQWAGSLATLAVSAVPHHLRNEEAVLVWPAVDRYEPLGPLDIRLDGDPVDLAAARQLTR